MPGTSKTEIAMESGTARRRGQRLQTWCCLSAHFTVIRSRSTVKSSLCVSRTIPRQHLSWHLPVRDRVRASAFVSLRRRPVAACKSSVQCVYYYMAQMAWSRSISARRWPRRRAWESSSNFHRGRSSSGARKLQPVTPPFIRPGDGRSIRRYSLCRTFICPMHCKDIDVWREIHKTVGCRLVIRFFIQCIYVIMKKIVSSRIIQTRWCPWRFTRESSSDFYRCWSSGARRLRPVIPWLTQPGNGQLIQHHSPRVVRLG